MTPLRDAILPSRAAVVATFPVRTARELAPGAERPLFRHCQCPDSWVTDDTDDRRYEDFDPALAQELRQAAPHFVAELSAEGLLLLLPDDVLGLTACFAGEPVQLIATGGHLGVTPVGYGTITINYEVSSSGAGGPEMVDLSFAAPLEERIDSVVMRLVCDLEVTADPRDGFPAEPVSALPCLWSHVLYLFDEPEVCDLPGLAPVADEERVEVRLAGGVLRPGLGSSYVAGADGAVHARSVRVLALVSAYYAALADVDRRIFSSLATWRHRRPPASASGPSGRLFEEVSLFQAVLQTLDLHLAASTAFDVRVWTAMTRVWRMQGQLDALTSKLELLRTFQARQVEQAGLARSHRLTVVALAFTVLSFLGVLLDLVQFGQEPPLSTPEPWRTVLSVLFVGAVALAFSLGVSRRQR